MRYGPVSVLGLKSEAESWIEEEEDEEAEADLQVEEEAEAEAEWGQRQMRGWRNYRATPTR